MKYDFVSRVDRRNTGSAKWLDMENKNKKVREGIIPLSVADMEFVHPRELIEGLKTYLDEAILGYTVADDSFYEAVITWMKNRHDFDVEKEWIVNTGGVVPAIFNAINTLTEENDGIIIFTPVYYPFYKAINLQNRKVVACPLINENGTYEIDFELFEALAKKTSNRVLLFCSPHNPVARVWKREELEKLKDIILKNDLILISDEIHFDLIMPGYTHTVFQTIDEALSQRTITMTAPSKSFNIAGMGISNVIIKSKELREKFVEGLRSTAQIPFTSLGFVANKLVYSTCETWLDECIEVINGNHKYVKDFFNKTYPQIKVYPLEGTYLQWIDFIALGLSYKDLEDFMINEAELFLDEGYLFGKDGEGFERINLACPREVIEQALERLDKAIKGRFV